MLQDQDIETLAKLGLSPNQAKVYLTLVNVGDATVNAVSRVSQVHRQDIYRTTAELLSIGLLERIIVNPAKFRAIPLSEGIPILLGRIHKENSESQRKALELMQRYGKQEIAKDFDKEKSQLILVPEKEIILRRLRSEIDNVQMSVDIITTNERFLQAMDFYSESYLKALSRKVEVRIVLEKPKEKMTSSKTVQDLLAKSNFKLRYISTPPPANLAIFDQKRAFVAFYPGNSLTKSPAVFTNHPSFLSMFKDHFEVVWTKAVENKMKRQMPHSNIIFTEI